MQHTEEQKRSFKEEFDQRKKRQYMATVPAIAAILGMVFLERAQGGSCWECRWRW